MTEQIIKHNNATLKCLKDCINRGDYIAKNKDYIFSCSDDNFNKNYEEVK